MVTTEKKNRQYTESNLIKIDGKGRTKEEICLAYIERIQNGFTMTIDDIASYLRCTYQHVIKSIVPEVQHIRITELGKSMLLNYSKEHGNLENFALLFIKRILVNKEDFQRYICEKAELIVSHKRFYLNDFHPEVLEQIKEKLTHEKNKQKGRALSIGEYIAQVFRTFEGQQFNNQPVTLKSLQHFPVELLSQRDLMEDLQLNYKMEFYRYLDFKGICKIKIGNMVRYRREDLDEEFLASMYISTFHYLQQTYGDKYIEVIEEKALQLLE